MDLIDTSKSLTIAICAFNEEANILSTIRSVYDALKLVPDLRYEVLVMDDGSTDNTAIIVERILPDYSNLFLIKNIVNLGLGSSIRKAIQAGKMNKFIFIPGDNDIPVSTLTLLFKNAYAADIVMTYFQNDESRGRSRYLLSMLFKVIYSTTFNLYLIYVNGPAVYPADRLKKLNLISTKFSIVVEINIKLLRQGLTFVELPSNRQVGLLGSTSASFKSLLEVIKVYAHLFFYVHVKNRSSNRMTPKRIEINFDVTN